MSADITWKVVGWAVTLLTALIPAYVAYDLYDRGPPPSPKRRVELSQLQPINPAEALTTLGDKATLSIWVEGRALDNIRIVQAQLTNAGNDPILPTDYHGKLNVSVAAPWRIVAVANGSPSLQLRWKRVSDTVFEAEPALLNPSDSVTTYIYLTNTKHADAAASDDTVRWSARIANLSGFDTPKPWTFDLPRTWWVFHLEKLGNRLHAFRRVALSGSVLAPLHLNAARTFPEGVGMALSCSPVGISDSQLLGSGGEWLVSI